MFKTRIYPIFISNYFSQKIRCFDEFTSFSRELGCISYIFVFIKIFIILANSEDDSNNNNLGRTEDVTRQIHDEQVTNILEQPQQQLNNPSSPIRTSADTPHNRGKRPRMNNESPEPSDAFRHQKASKLHGSWTSSDSNSGSGNKSPEALKLGSEIHQNICTICLSPFFGNERKSELEHLPCSVCLLFNKMQIKNYNNKLCSLIMST